MPVLLIRHTVADYDGWWQDFSRDVETRRANGSLSDRHWRSATNPDEIWILLEWDDLFRAQLFVRSDDLIGALERSGIVGRPDFWYLDEPVPPPG